MAKISAGQIELGSDKGLTANGRSLELEIKTGAALAFSTGLEVVVDDSSIENNSGTMRVKASGITDAMLAGSISEGKLANTFIRADGSNNFSADQDMGGFKLTSLGTPTAGTDAVTKAYADAIVSGLSDFKASVIAVVDRDSLPAYTQAGAGSGATLTADANGALAAQDGVTLEAGERCVVLETDGGAHADNGVYTVTQVGDGSNPWILTRATDFDDDAEVTSGAYVYVEEGTTYGSYAFVVNTSGAITVDTTAISLVPFSSISGVEAGDGLSKSGVTISLASGSAGDGLAYASGVLSVNVNDSSIETSGDTLQVKALGITNGMLAGSIANAKLANSSITITPGAGLASDGDGTLALGDTETFSIGAGAGITVNADDVAIDYTQAPTWTGDHVFQGLVSLDDWQLAGLIPKVVAKSVGSNVAVATDLEQGDTLDGVTLAEFDLVLLIDQDTASENGIYEVVGVGAGAASKSADYDESALSDAHVLVTGGTVNKGTIWFTGPVGSYADLANARPSFTSLIEDGLAVKADGKLAVKVSDIAGSGLADDGSNNLRIAVGGIDNANLFAADVVDEVALNASVAGAGLTGGGGSALAVGAGNGITVNANDVALAATVAGAGLTHTTGVLAVVAAANGGLTVNADDVQIDWSMESVVKADTDFTGADLTNALTNTAAGTSHPMTKVAMLFLNGVLQIPVADDTADPASGEWCFISSRTKIRLGDAPTTGDKISAIYAY